MASYRPRSEGDNVLGSIHPYVCLSIRRSVCVSVQALRVQQKAITLKFGVKGVHYRSEGFVCNQWGGGYADNLADAVDQLLIFVLKMEVILSWHIRHIVCFPTRLHSTFIKHFCAITFDSI